MQNTDFNQSPKKKSYKKLLISIVLILGLLLINILALYFFLGGDKNEKPQTVQVEQNQIFKSNLLDTKEIKSNGISFEVPGGYISEEQVDGIFIITSEENDEESSITVNTTNANNKEIDFEEFVSKEEVKLKEVVQKELLNGIKILGIHNTTTKLTTYIKTSNGLVIIESSGENINEAVFDVTSSSIKEG